MINVIAVAMMYAINSEKRLFMFIKSPLYLQHYECACKYQQYIKQHGGGSE